ncbi:hypothetical protein [Adhaeribacter pallidiroseus]|nr:hypothetical protein [Adhaeribacter pallidiroseus]
MKKILVFVTALFWITACEQEEILNNSGKEQEASTKSIIGKWNWIRTDGGLAFHIHETPKTTGKEITLEFKANNQFRKYVNGVLESQGTYSLSSRTCIHTHEEKQVISIPSEMDMMIESMDANNLQLSDENFDGLGSQYQRK